MILNIFGLVMVPFGVGFYFFGFGSFFRHLFLQLKKIRIVHVDLRQRVQTILLQMWSTK